MKELHELIKYLKDNGYAHLKVDPDLLVGIIEYFGSRKEQKRELLIDFCSKMEEKAKEYKHLIPSEDFIDKYLKGEC